MKKKVSSDLQKIDDMRAEYDFPDGVRGKYAVELKEQGYTIRVQQADGTYTERTVLGEKVVVLEQDVWEPMGTSQSASTSGELRIGQPHSFTFVRLSPVRRKSCRPRL